MQARPLPKRAGRVLGLPVSCRNGMVGIASGGEPAQVGVWPRQGVGKQWEPRGGSPEVPPAGWGHVAGVSAAGLAGGHGDTSSLHGGRLHSPAHKGWQP